MTASTKRILAGILAAATLLGTLAGCKGKTDANNDSKDPAQTLSAPDNTNVRLEHAYTETEIEFSSNSSAQNLVYADGRIYFIRHSDSQMGRDISENNADEIINYVELVSVNLEGADEQVLRKWENSYVIDSRVSSTTQLRTFNRAKDGTFVLIEESYHYDETDPMNPEYENSMRLIRLSADGEELLTKELGDEVDTENMYIERMLFDAEGNVFLTGWDAIVVLDGQTLEHLFTQREPNGGMQGGFVTPEGEVAYLTYGMDGLEFKMLDVAAKTAKPGKTYVGDKYFSNALSDGFGDYAFCFPYQSNIYGFNLETMTEELVVSGANSDADLRNIGSMITLDDGFIVSKYLDEGGTALTRLVENPNAMVGDKQIITLGVLYSGQIEGEVLRFNKSSTTARIMITDYSQYNTADDYMAGMTRLDADLIAGRAPDIICFSDGLQASKYAAKGVLTDLYPILDADPTLSREDLFENILKAGEVDGKLAHIIAGFGIYTLAGKQSIFGDITGITTQELARIADSRPDSRIMEDMVDVESWLQLSVMLGLDTYVDWTTGTCSFDNPDFIAMLEFATRFPKEVNYDNIDWNVRDREVSEALADGRILLQIASFYDGIRSVRSLKAQFGEDAAYVGFPAPEGQSGHVITAAMDFGISEASQNKELAWEFIRSFLAEDFSSGERWNEVLSANKAKFDRIAAEELLPLSERDLSKGINVMIQVGNSGWGTSIYSEEEYIDFVENIAAQTGINVEEMRKYELTAAEVAAARGVIESATVSVSHNEQIYAIIQEEAQSFISGAKTAEESARIIQSRVSLYVAETY